MGGLFSLSISTSVSQWQLAGGWIALIVCGMWTVFAACLYRVCFKKSLAVQK
jgi:hypothetical protein